jgi:hypothetical protein
MCTRFARRFTQIADAVILLLFQNGTVRQTTLEGPFRA